MFFVPYIQDADIQSLAAIDKAFETVKEYKVSCCNWPELYPYTPDMSFKLFHTGDCIVIQYSVTEDCTAAVAEEDLGKVWEDSCAEFFFQPYGEGKYYNIEASCIGKVLLAHRTGRKDAVRAPKEALDGIRRYASLGNKPFTEIQGPVSWKLTLVIPVSSLFEDSISDLHGMKARFNVYKCGDKLSKPHFISFAPIGTERPDFHRPEYFTEMSFE